MAETMCAFTLPLGKYLLSPYCVPSQAPTPWDRRARERPAIPRCSGAPRGCPKGWDQAGAVDGREAPGGRGAPGVQGAGEEALGGGVTGRVGTGGMGQIAAWGGMPLGEGASALGPVA